MAALSYFGPGVVADTTVARRESLEISILFIALGAISAYRRHLDDIQWFAAHLRNIVRRVLPPAPSGSRVEVEEVGTTVASVPRDAAEPTVSPLIATLNSNDRLSRVQFPALPILAIEAAVLVGLLAAILGVMVTD
jgi:hypothetical protein